MDCVGWHISCFQHSDSRSYGHAPGLRSFERGDRFILRYRLLGLFDERYKLHGCSRHRAGRNTSLSQFYRHQRQLFLRGWLWKFDRHSRTDAHYKDYDWEPDYLCHIEFPKCAIKFCSDHAEHQCVHQLLGSNGVLGHNYCYPECSASGWQDVPIQLRLGNYPGSLWAADRDHAAHAWPRSEEHTSELQSLTNLVCR